MYPEIVKSTITIEFQKEGYDFLIFVDCSHIFASTHGDHTVKIVDFATGKILRVLVKVSILILDTNWSSKNSMGGKVPSSKSRYSCEWMYWFNCDCVELEEK